MRRTPLRRGSKPLRPRVRPEVREVNWRTGAVKETAAGIARLRAAAYHRSNGICECGREECVEAPMRLRRVTWSDGQLHHLKIGHAVSDELDRVRFIRRECHDILTGRPQWTRHFKPRDLREGA